MGVDLLQYRSAIGSFVARASKVGPRSRSRRRKEAWQEISKEAGARGKVREEAAAFWMEALNTSIFISLFISFTLSVAYSYWPLLTTTPLDSSRSTSSTSWTPDMPSSPPTGDLTSLQKVNLLHHLEDYFDLTDTTLIKTTDELCENMHQFLNRMLLRSVYYVKDVSNRSHGLRLFRAVKHLNSYNIYIKK
jgi:hypothetical protein